MSNTRGDAAKDRRRKYRLEVLTHYGRGTLACVQCGFSDVRALCLDHVDGSSQIRRTKKVASESYWRMFLQERFPDGYQTLCANCNLIKAVERGELNGHQA